VGHLLVEEAVGYPSRRAAPGAVRRAPARVRGRVGLRRYAGEIILDAMGAPCQGLSFFLPMRCLYCVGTSATRAPLAVALASMSTSMSKLRASRSERAGALSVLRLSGVLARRLGWGSLGGPLRVL